MDGPLKTITCSLVHVHEKCHTARRLPASTSRDVCAQAFPDFSMFNQRVMKRSRGRPGTEATTEVTTYTGQNNHLFLQCSHGVCTSFSVRLEGENGCPPTLLNIL